MSTQVLRYFANGPARLLAVNLERLVPGVGVALLPIAPMGYFRQQAPCGYSQSSGSVIYCSLYSDNEITSRHERSRIVIILRERAVRILNDGCTFDLIARILVLKRDPVRVYRIEDRLPISKRNL